MSSAPLEKKPYVELPYSIAPINKTQILVGKPQILVGKPQIFVRFFIVFCMKKTLCLFSNDSFRYAHLHFAQMSLLGSRFARTSQLHSKLRLIIPKLIVIN